jgi:hypothetical protein
MDWFELENLEAIRIAIVLAGLLGALDLAIGHLSGSAIAVPCAIGAIAIHAYQKSKDQQKSHCESRD